MAVLVPTFFIHVVILIHAHSPVFSRSRSSLLIFSVGHLSYVGLLSWYSYSIPGLRCSSLSSSLYVFWYCGILDELWATGAVSRLGEFGGLAEFKSSSAVSAHPS